MKHTYRQNGKKHTKVQRITAKPNNRKKRIRTKHFPHWFLTAKKAKSGNAVMINRKNYSKLLQVICY